MAYTDLPPYRAAADPGVTDDSSKGFIAGASRWLNTTTNTLYFCVRATVGAALWTALGGGIAIIQPSVWQVDYHPASVTATTPEINAGPLYNVTEWPASGGTLPDTPVTLVVAPVT